MTKKRNFVSVRALPTTQNKDSHSASQKQRPHDTHKSVADASESNPMNDDSMRISPYIQKSKPYKTKKRKDKTVKEGKAGNTDKTCDHKNSTENKTTMDLPECCKSDEECKCCISCFETSEEEKKCEDKDVTD